MEKKISVKNQVPFYKKILEKKKWTKQSVDMLRTVNIRTVLIVKKKKNQYYNLRVFFLENRRKYYAERCVTSTFNFYIRFNFCICTENVSKKLLFTSQQDDCKNIVVYRHYCIISSNSCVAEQVVLKSFFFLSR